MWRVGQEQGSDDALGLVLDLLLGIREVIAGDRAAYQNMFRWGASLSNMPQMCRAAELLPSAHLVICGSSLHTTVQLALRILSCPR